MTKKNSFRKMFLLNKLKLLCDFFFILHFIFLLRKFSEIKKIIDIQIYLHEFFAIKKYSSVFELRKNISSSINFFFLNV